MTKEEELIIPDDIIFYFFKFIGFQTDLETYRKEGMNAIVTEFEKKTKWFYNKTYEDYIRPYVRIAKALIVPISDIINDLFDLGGIERSTKVRNFVSLFSPFVTQTLVYASIFASIAAWYFAEKFVTRTDTYTLHEWENLQGEKKAKYFKITEKTETREFDEFTYQNEIITDPEWELIDIKEVKE